MSLANRFVGKNWYGRWVYTTGTATLSGDQRSFEWPRTGETVDATAGSDSVRGPIALFNTEKFTLSRLASTDGTTDWNSGFAPNTVGTLTFSEGDGTANGKPKYTAPAMVTDASTAMPFDGVVEWKIGWQGTGAVVAGTWSVGA